MSIRGSLIFALGALLMAGWLPVDAQTAAPYAFKKPPNPGGNSYPTPDLVPYPNATDALQRRIDLFMGDWHEALPRHTHGSLILRDILMRGDNFAPAQRGAVFERFNALSHGILAAHNATIPEMLNDHQEVYYVLSGSGEVVAGGKAAAVAKDFAFIIPAHLEFSLRNTGDDALTMYVINEPLPPGFKAVSKVPVINEREVAPTPPKGESPYTTPGATGHWAHIVRNLFNRTDGLATMGSLITVTLAPLTMGEPHTHEPGHEEIWASLEGTTLAFMGSQLRMQRPGMAYMLRPDVTMTHSNINFGDTPVKFLWFSVSRTSDSRTIIVNQPLVQPGTPPTSERR